MIYTLDSKDSSYTKIYKSLANLPEAQPDAVIEWVHQYLSKMEVSLKEFGVSKSIVGGHMTATGIGTFQITHNGSYVDSENENLMEHLRFHSNDLLKKWAFDLLDKHFGNGKTVKTYNVLINEVYGKEVVKVIHTKTRRSKRQTSFGDWYKDNVVGYDTAYRMSLDSAVGIHSSRIQREVREMVASPEFQEKKKKALVNYAVDEIRNLLLAYREVDESEIKRAIAEAQVMGIVEF